MNVKYTAILPNLILSIIIVLAVCWLIIASMMIPTFQIIPPLYWVIPILIMCIVLHKLSYSAIQFIKLPEYKLNFPELNADYAYIQYSGLICLVIFVLLLPFIYSFFISSLVNIFTSHKSLTPAFYTILITIIGYVLLGRPLINRSTKLFYLGSYPSYQLNNNGIIINNNIYINFDEIGSIICYEPQEAYAMYYFVFNAWYEIIRYQFSSFIISKDRNEQLYFRLGRIKRPSVYLGSPGNGKTLLFRGKELFYFVTFDKNDPSDIVDTFNDKHPGDHRFLAK
jgi:hypothetical protein